MTEGCCCSSQMGRTTSSDRSPLACLIEYHSGDIILLLCVFMGLYWLASILEPIDDKGRQTEQTASDIVSQGLFFTLVCLSIAVLWVIWGMDDGAENTCIATTLWPSLGPVRFHTHTLVYAFKSDPIVCSHKHTHTHRFSFNRQTYLRPSVDWTTDRRCLRRSCDSFSNSLRGRAWEGE